MLRAIKQRLPKMLGDWGLLRGQVEPALRILGATRIILSTGDGAQRRPKAGEREAWLLMALLTEPLAAPRDKVEAALSQLHLMHDLPILDHPRPANRPDTGDSFPEDRTPDRPIRTRRRPRRSQGRPRQ